MNTEVTTYSSAGYGISQEQRNKVMRNTYWLLALSLLPTVLGAWVGVATGITQALHGGIGMLVFLVAMIDAFLIYRRRAPANPWGEGATTLEWTLPSPPPFHQFNELPRFDTGDAKSFH